MSGRHIAGNGDGSLMKWAEGLKLAPEALREMAAHYRRLAQQALEEQPLNEGLRESLAAVATRCEAAADRAAGWYQTARSTMSDDFAAYEQPRDGSLHKESKSDVDRANDGN